MKLPNVHLAQIRREKIVNYLLSSTHRDGKSKHDFFVRFGFRPETWEQFADALKQHASEHDVTEQQQTRFGSYYVIEGGIRCPDGRSPLIRVVWFIERGDGVPQLVTAYPIRR